MGVIVLIQKLCRECRGCCTNSEAVPWAHSSLVILLIPFSMQRVSTNMLMDSWGTWTYPSTSHFQKDITLALLAITGKQVWMWIFEWAIANRFWLVYDDDWTFMQKLAFQHFTLEVQNLFTKATAFIPVFWLLLVMQ